MALLTVLTIPDPRLRIKAEPVAQVDDTVRRLMADMVETMYADDGAGLAATQVGITKRVIVFDISDHFPDLPLMKMANPEIIWRSKETVTEPEACLSVPEQFANVKRFKAVRVRYIDEHNQPQEIEGEGLLAKCLQHEIDHLDGIVYIDHLSTLKRQLIIQKVQKLKKLSKL
ncbi:MAG: peptide deformylase [Alphaproteobacteria bacterium]|nr:peptide deformylase [Alphaproteobacteria bacterium]